MIVKWSHLQMIHRFRWYLIAVFISFGVYNQHDDTNYHRPHKELLNDFHIITPTIAQSNRDVLELDRKPILYNRKDIQCLAKNIFFEAGTESMLGKIAVGQVTVNRVKIGHWGETVCDVVHAKDQFSWTNKDDLSIDKDSKPYRDSVVAANRVLQERKRLRILKSALFYHADYVRPNWVDKNQKIIKIGTHVFYNGAKGSSLSL
jgi:spore germination cell wall hydrolase CwlJ-like protein